MSQHYEYELTQKQSLPLEAKVRLTQVRIREWYDAFDGNVYISFSGGKDSTVLLDIARQMYPDTPAVFSDTGLEYPEIREFVKTVKNVTWVKPKMNFRQVIQTYGYPVISKNVSHNVSIAKRNPNGAVMRNIFSPEKKGPYAMYPYKWLLDAPFDISATCCDVMKKAPLHRYEKETGDKPILATMACESKLRKDKWMKYSCNAFDIKDPHSAPMSFWTEQDVLRYLKEYSVPYCPVYGEIAEDKNGKLRTTGCPRTGCMFCMFGVQREKSPNRFQLMKQTHPSIYRYCMKPMSEGGLGLDEVLTFIGVDH